MLSQISKFKNFLSTLRWLSGFLVFFVNLPSLASGFDVGAEIAARSIPLAGSLSAKVGYGLILWGDPSKKDNYLYGYIRPQIKAQTSLGVSIAEFRLDVSPVAPLVLSLGHSDSYRANTFVDVDCIQNFCRGQVSRNYLQVSSILGKGPAFLGGIVRITQSSTPAHSGSYYDELFSLYGAAGADRFTEWDAFFGVRLSEEHSVGILVEDTLVQKSTLQSQLRQAFYEYKLHDWSFSTGGGIYESDLQKKAPTVFLRIKWSGEKKAPGIL
jgi:hypothetical protein